MFRVRAENIVGVGEALVGEPVTAKDPFDPPAPPGCPDVLYVDSNQVRLKWTPPPTDGGSPITGYVVEKFDKKGGGDWSPVTFTAFPGMQTLNCANNSTIFLLL